MLHMSTYQIIQLDGSDALVHARDDLHGDSSGIHMLRVEAIAESGHSRRNLVELHAFLAAICNVR